MSISGTVIGVDSSTQSCKVMVVDAATGQILSRGSAPHPDGTSVDPREWTKALNQAWDAAGARERSDVLGVGVSAQQHGMVALDSAGAPVHDALLWNDVRSAPQARAMVEELEISGWVEATGSAPVTSITLTKLAWLRENVPEAAARVERVGLPHDWLVSELTGGAWITDRSEASGSGWFDPASGSIREDLLERWFGAAPQVPEVLAPHASAGTITSDWLPNSPGAVVSAGCGDNAGGGLGLGIGHGDVVVSVGTSGTVFAHSPHPIADPTGVTSGFADATGAYLPLLCTLNAARVMARTSDLLGTDLDVPIERALLIGGGSRSATLRTALTHVLGVDIDVPAPDEYVALGGARQAYWAAQGELPAWTAGTEGSQHLPAAQDDGADAFRARYSAMRRQLEDELVG